MSRSALAFERTLDGWILDLADDVESFDELVSALPGVYPPIAGAAVERLATSKRLSGRRLGTCRRRVDRRRRGRVIAHQLPPPHPLDFDWRYAPSAVDHLLDVVRRRSADGDIVVMIGTPSLFLAAQRSGLDRTFVLIDANKTTVCGLRELGFGRGLLHRDVFTGEVPDLGASVVVADPPWYPEHVDAFLWAAATCSRPEASVLISLPAVGTRPGIPKERREFRESAHSQGLCVTRTSAGALPYVSPPFEVNALRAAGWISLPLDWRRGDLVELRRRGAPGVRPDRTPGDPRWEERSLGAVRIRTRRRRPSGCDPRLKPVVEGDVLADVSRRNPIRSRVDVWTSGNRIFECSDPAVVAAILDALTSGSDPIEAAVATIGRALIEPEESNIARAVSQLQRLCQTESRELSRLGWTDSRQPSTTSSR
jgi:hypothetical protein